MPRPKNSIKTEQITIAANAVICGEIDQIIKTGHYGNSRAEAALRLVSDGIERLIQEEILVRKAKRIKL